MKLNNLKKLSGDASFRSFYRKKNHSQTSIIVFCKKQKKSNLVIYEAINNLLIKENLLAPKMIDNNYNKNYIEIEDLGDNSIYKILKKKKNKLKIYLNIIKTLKLMQKINFKSIKTFKRKKYIIPRYTKNKLLNEAKLFLEWYLPKVLKKKKIKKAKNQINNILDNLYKQLKLNKQVFVHRDFHVSNMIYHQKKIYLIDGQDAVYGNIAYDLASLVDDVRYKSSKNLKEKIYSEFIKLKVVNKKNFKNDFEILSVLRNLKIIGIFTRLSVRDKKDKYLKLIPYAWNLIELRIKDNDNFKELKLVLNNFFSKKIRRLK